MKRFLLLLLAATPVGAQNLPFKPLPTVRVQLTCRKYDLACQQQYGVKSGDKWWEPLAVTHRTADTAFLESTGIAFGATVMDVENSVYALSKPGIYEINPIFGKHPNRGRYYGIMLPATGAFAYYSYKWKRQDDALKAAGLAEHKYMKWWVPNALMTATHVFGTLFTLDATGR
jgi:hypothetical protein